MGAEEGMSGKRREESRATGRGVEEEERSDTSCRTCFAAGSPKRQLASGRAKKLQAFSHPSRRGSRERALRSQAALHCLLSTPVAAVIAASIAVTASCTVVAAELAGEADGDWQGRTVRRNVMHAKLPGPLIDASEVRACTHQQPTPVPQPKQQSRHPPAPPPPGAVRTAVAAG